MTISAFCDNNTEENFIFSNEEIEKYAQCILKYVIDNSLTEDFSDKYDYSLEVLICNNDFIHKINKEYREKDTPTDVITFALYYDADDKVIVDNIISLGQILISSDKVKEQAKENNIDEKDEFLNLLSHGILHLTGFTHDDENSLNNMLDLQSKIIESVKNVKI